MALVRAYRLLSRRASATHSIPVFNGRHSRRHRNAPLWKLRALAHAINIVRLGRFGSVETFVQFAGFPRSGHSLIGSILDAHPHARISHELDTMGLLHKGFSQASLLALIDAKSTEFTRHGRCWNGYSYLVPRAGHSDAAALRVMGDKKGDAAVRWVAQNPELLDKLSRQRVASKKWILVLRNPLDNIATMSLRKGRAYDQLKTRVHAKPDFQRALKVAQEQGTIASQALDSQIDDYASLCQTVERIKQATARQDWFELCHEDFAVRPEAVIQDMLSFVGLAADETYVDNCAGLVHRRPNRSRHQLIWSESQRARVRSLNRQFSFLNRYTDDDDA